MSKRGSNDNNWAKPLPKAQQNKGPGNKKYGNRVVRSAKVLDPQNSTPMPNKDPQPMALESDISAFESLPALSLSTASSEDCATTNINCTNLTNVTDKESAEEEHDRVMTAYAKYLQVVMLDIQAKKTLQRVNTEAVRVTTSLANHVYLLKEEFHNLKTNLDKVKSLKLLKQQVARQNEILDILNTSLGSLENYYTLSNCVDDCSHKLPVRDIATDQKEIESLVEKLNIGNKLVKELTTKACMSEVSEDSEALTNTKDILEEAVDSVRKCDESLEAMTSLAIQTTSLQIEKMQGTISD